MRVRTYSSLDELPAAYAGLFDEAGRESFFLSLPWFRNLIDTTGEPGNRIRLYGVERDAPEATPLALLITRWREPDRALIRRLTGAARLALEGYTNYYTGLYGPILSPAERDLPKVVQTLVTTICAERPRWNLVHLELLNRDWPVFDMLVDAFRATGMIVEPYFQFGNWYEKTEDGSFQAYLRRRSSKVRNNFRRRIRKLERSVDVRTDIITNAHGLEAGIAAFEKVYNASWKIPEQYPRFIPGLIRTAAQAGSLRLGILYVDNEPGAAQLSFVTGGVAWMYRTAYDERFKELSVGTVLVLRMLEHVIEVDRVRVVDFGYGDDSYKEEWMSERRERWGILAFNPRTVMGVLSALRHFGGRRVKKVLRDLRGLRAIALAWITSLLPALHTSELFIETASGRHRFVVELANTPDQRDRGLMFRRSLTADAGMLFDYGRQRRLTMWMKNTLISLDMVFIARGGRIVKIAAGTVPLSSETIPSGGPVRGVLEVNGGTASRLGIEVGDRVIHPIFAGGD